MTQQAEDLGFDPDALRARYRAERDKRLRADGNNQYIEVTGEFSHYIDDPYVAERIEREIAQLELKLEEAEAAQAESDKEGGGVDFVFDIPLDLAAELTGFRHDEMGFDDDIPPFTALERTHLT